MNGINNLIKRFVFWYLRRFGGAFHHGEYGVGGRYVVIVRDHEYYILRNMVMGKTVQEFASQLKTAEGWVPIDPHAPN